MEIVIKLDRQEEYLERRKSVKSISDWSALFEDFPDVKIEEDAQQRYLCMLVEKANSPTE